MKREADKSNMTGGDFYRIFPDMGVCDPHVHIYNGKAWLFSTHDRGPGQPIFRMDDWRIFSSDDLVNWKLEATVRPEDTFLGPCEECYAVDSARRNGKYYFYFSHQQFRTGVMVSEKGPAGPYNDVLGEPLLPPRLAETPSYDPTVFVDDDENQTPYIMWGYTLGTDHYYIARLNEDMISLAEEPKMVEIENGWQNDASWISKFGGVYYLNSHEGDYATSNSIYGPYSYRGKICQDCFTDHGTFFTFRNQLYFTYAVPENFGRNEPLDRYFRTMKIVYAHLKENGEIVTDDFIKKVGVGHYDAGWDFIESEWYFDASDGIVKKENGDGFTLAEITNGAHVTFPKIKNVPEKAKLRICVSNGNDAPCTVEIRKENENGRLLGTCTVESTGGFDAYQAFDVQLKNTAGTFGLCFVFKSESPEALRFDRFSFIENPMKGRMTMKKAISVSLTALLPLGLSVPAFAASIYESDQIPTGSVRMIAHMGYSAVAPANTLPSYIAAGESDFWGAECDIQRTADGVWILMHNDTVDAMTDGTGPVIEKTYAEMMELNVDAGNNIDQYPGLKVATLQQYLDVCKAYGLHPVIEIKANADPVYMDEVAAILSARAEKDMFYVISFGREICVRMKTLMPELRVYYLISYEDVSREDIDFALESGLDGMDIHVFLPEDYVKDVVNSGLDVFVWTIDDLDNAERLYNLGVNAITTNSLTQEKPEGSISQKTKWFFRDFFYKIKMSFKTLIDKIKN